MKNKADLYKISNPNRIGTIRPKFEFNILIGTYEKSQLLIVNAYDVHDALNEGSNYCNNSKNEEVLEVRRNGVSLWKHEYF